MIYCSLLTVITKVTYELRCCELNSALLNHLEVEILARFVSKRNFGDILGQMFLQQVIIKMFPREVKTS